MKKISIGCLLLFALSVNVKAQDYKKVRQAILISQVPGGEAKLEEAKTELDKVAADPKAAENAETHLLRAEINGMIVGNETLRAKYPNADVEGLQALKKYLQLQPGEEKLKEDKYAGINQIYSAMFNAGVKSYNDKDWDNAFNKFKDVAELGDMFVARKWSNSSFDTTSYLYAGATAQNAKKQEEAAKYYGVIAEHKVVGKDYESIYDFLVKYYLGKNDQANFTKYLALSKTAYPENKLWNDLEFANMTDNSPIEDVVKKYEAGDASKALTATDYLDYGDYFINNKKIKELEPANRVDYTNRAMASFAKAAELEPTNGIAAYNAGVAAYNLFEDASDKRMAIKGVTPAIKAKQAEADKVVDAAADKSIEWLEKSYKTMDAKAEKSSIEKNSTKSSAKLLSVLFSYKKDRSKGKAAEYDKNDAKFKFYDTKY